MKGNYIKLSDGTTEIEIQIDSLEDQLADQGYAADVLPRKMPYFAFWAPDRSILLHGHKVREIISQEYKEHGYTIRG